MKELEKFAKEKKVKYFMISFTDLLEFKGQSLYRQRQLQTCKRTELVLLVLRVG